jgi:hypothetical protein
MIKNQKVKLEIRGNVKTYTWIGAGATAYAYTDIETPSLVTIFIPDIKFTDTTSLEDTTKDSLVLAYKQNPGNPYLPQIEYVGHDFVGGPELNTTCKIYTMPFYRDIRQSDRAEFLEMKKLHKVRDVAMHELYDIYENATGKKGSMQFLGNKAAKRACTIAKEKLNVTLVAALRAIYNNIAVGHPGVTFEFNKKNLGYDSVSNHLILRDPIYDAVVTVKIREERKRNNKNN